MNKKRFFWFSLLNMFMLLSGCTNEDFLEKNVQNIPDQFRDLENIIVFSLNKDLVQSYHLEYIQTYGDSDEIFYEWISAFAVDNTGRVFLGESFQNRKAIHVFEPNGSYLTSIGREGKGPGEFIVISDMDIVNSKLYVYDNGQKRISVFSLQDLSYSDTIQFGLEEFTNTEEFTGLQENRMVKIVHDGSFLMRSSTPLPLTLHNRPQEVHRTAGYFYRDEKGHIVPKLILNLKEPDYYISDKQMRDGFVMPFTAPFTRSSLLSVATDGTIFTAWTEDFLIKVYDSDGTYLRAFYYPHKKSELSRTEALTFAGSQEAESLIREQGFPDTWPALHTMILDDENRLWIATITDDEENYQWIVLDETGDFLATYHFPGERASRKVDIPISLIMIKEGFFYTRETDEETCLQQIIKYRIEMN